MNNYKETAIQYIAWSVKRVTSNKLGILWLQKTWRYVFPSLILQLCRPTYAGLHYRKPCNLMRLAAWQQSIINNYNQYKYKDIG